jgi:hypothetical protein
MKPSSFTSFPFSSVAEYQMQIKAQKHELQANMDWLKSKGIFELELEMPDMKGIELSLTAY